MKLGKIEYRDEKHNWNSPLPPNYTACLGNFTPEDMRSIFASCWLPKSVTPDQCANMDRQEYENMISLTDKYEPRVQPHFAQWITAYLNNSQNSYLLTIVAPWFHSDELNFKTLKEEIMQVGCDWLEEGGIASEGASTRWGWHDTLSRASTRRTISQELALDVNYGAETILKTLADIGQNVVYHCLRNVMHSIREIGYGNIVRETLNDEHVDIAKLYAAEAEAFHIYAKDPHGALKLMISKAVKFGGDLAIMKEGASQYLSPVLKEEPRQIPAQSVTYDRSTKTYTGMPREGGPMSFLSYRLGDRWFDMIENTSWQVSSRSTYREDPLEVTTVHGQYYGPNPDYRADDEVVSTNPDNLATILYYQTRTQDSDKKVTFSECLRNCFRWNLDDGKHSDIQISLVSQMNQKLTMSNGNERPFQYQKRTLHQNGDELGDYDSPSEEAMAELRSTETDDFRQMKTIRDIPSGVTYDPNLKEFRNAKRIGDHHLDQTPNKWIMRAVRTLRLKYEEETKRNIMEDFDQIFAWLENVSNAEVTADYIYALIDANLPADGDQDFFKDNGVLEFILNNHHSLKLPNSTDPRVAGLRYANGFQSGAGMKTAADELLKRGTVFVQMAEEAARALIGAETIIRFLKKYVVKSDVIDYKMVQDWFQIDKNKKETNDAVLIAFIDAIYPSEGPTFLAVPDRRVGISDSVRLENLLSLHKYLETETLTDLNEIDTNTTQTGVVTDGIRALSYISKAIAQKHKAEFITPTTQSTELIKFINNYSSGKNANIEGNRHILNAITDEFFLLLTQDPTGKLASEFLVNVTKDPTASLPKLKGSEGYKNTTPTLNGPLTRWEAASAKKSDNRPSLAEVVKKIPARDYSKLGKTKYLRSPLIQSPTLRLFIQEQGQKWAWVLPGDPNSNYTAPIFDVTTINTSFDERGFMSHFQQLSGKTSVLNAMPEAFTSGNLGEGMTEDDLMELGVPYEGSRQSRFTVEEKIVKEDEILLQLRREYFGPWQNRMEFLENLTDRTDKVLFQTLLEAEDNLFVHEGLARIGAKLINVMLFRPCITTRSSSVIVMKKGIETVGTPMSRLIVDLSSEARGYLTIVCSFYIGTLRVTPSAIALLLAAVPVDFVGGKTTSFIKSPKELFSNDRDRGSMIAIDIPISETIHDDTLTLDNGRAMLRPDTYETPFSGKWSGSPKLGCVFGSQDISNIYGYHCERTQFKAEVPNVAFVQHRGPRSYIDPRSGHRVDHEGSGPGGDRCMNMQGAYKVWNGTAQWYPAVTTSVLTKARAQ